MKFRFIILGMAFLGLSIFLFVGNPSLASAESWFEEWSATAVAGIIGVGFHVLRGIGVLLFAFTTFLTKTALDFNFGILAPGGLIQTGWIITRDLANLGFVLVIIVIAIGTIVRLQEYQVQKLLPRLIAAAILVNFSLTFAGVIIDFSHVVTKTFFRAIDQGTDVSTGFSDALAGAFNPQNVLIQDDTEVYNQLKGGVSEETWFTKVIKNLNGLFFGALFTLIGAFTMGIFAFMLIVRYIYLSFLLILLPLACLSLVVPALSGQFSKWSQKFFSWTFFAPIVSFFFYLALRAIYEFNLVKDSEVTHFFPSDTTSIMNQGLQMIIVTGLMIGGMFAAQSMGITGANAAMKGLQTAQTWTKKQAWERTKSLGRRTATLGAASDKEGKSYLEKLGAGVGKIPLLGGLGAGISNIASKSKVTTSKAVDDMQKDFANRNTEDLQNLLRSVDPVRNRPERIAALAAELYKRGEGQWIENNKLVDKSVNASRKAKAGDKILAYAPHLAKEFGTTIEKAMQKVEDVTKIVLKPEIIPHLSLGQLNKIGLDASRTTKENVKTGLETAIGASSPRAKQLLEAIEKGKKDLEDAKAVGDTNKAKVIVAQMNQMENDIKALPTSQDERKALDKYRQFRSNLNYQEVL